MNLIESVTYLVVGVGATTGVKDEKKPEEKEPPSPPPEGLCCMSGCQNCVWLKYAEELLDYYKDGGVKAEEALNAVPEENLKTFLKMELRFKS